MIKFRLLCHSQVIIRQEQDNTGRQWKGPGGGGGVVGLGADPGPGLSHQVDVDVCSDSTIAQEEGSTQERGPQDRKFLSLAELPWLAPGQ